MSKKNLARRISVKLTKIIEDSMNDTNEIASVQLEIMKRRRSVRKFLPVPIPVDVLERIAAAGTFAPSSGNGQPCRFLVIDDKDIIQSLITSSADVLFEEKPDENAKQRFLASSRRYEKASAIILVLEDNESPYPEYSVHDCPLAAANIILLATSYGYGSTYLTDSICPDGIRRAISLPERYTPYCAIAIGVPDEIPHSPKKKPMTEVVWRNILGESFPT